MNAHATKLLTILLSTGAMFCGEATAASGDHAFNQAVRQYARPAANGQGWVNPHMPHGTGVYANDSATDILAAIFVTYTRERLDRGGWVNAWAPTPGYDAGNPLLAVGQGEGLTSRAA
jgi:hypothetical protein